MHDFITYTKYFPNNNQFMAYKMECYMNYIFIANESKQL